LSRLTISCLRTESRDHCGVAAAPVEGLSALAQHAPGHDDHSHHSHGPQVQPSAPPRHDAPLVDAPAPMHRPNAAVYDSRSMRNTAAMRTDRMLSGDPPSAPDPPPVPAPPSQAERSAEVIAMPSARPAPGRIITRHQHHPR
jgi:hypothetical protein